jgi:aldehyde:ferredoxin oxidoreductase
VPKFLGGRGIADKIAWDEIAPEVDAFDPENLLIVMTGPLTGTVAPTSGRTIFCGVAPQNYPRPIYTRSSMGGRWGSELKYAGYDGIVVKGGAETPVFIWIKDREVEIRDARELWGLDTIETQRRLAKILEEPEAKTITIGPAGERLSRIAVIMTDTESAAGQGGFGAVMGSKKLKAIAVRGTQGVKVAEPTELLRKSLAIAKEIHATMANPQELPLDPVKVRKYGERYNACSHACPARCGSRFYRRVPSRIDGDASGQFHCVAPLFAGVSGTFYDWKIGFESGFNLSMLANRMGLNHWELLLVTFPWLGLLKKDGLLEDLDGTPIDLNDPHFWSDALRKIAYREGRVSDALAEGTTRAAEILAIGQDQVRGLTTAHGYGGHWNGHADKINPAVFPYWIVSFLQWATDTRDPFSSGHGYTANLSIWSKVLRQEELEVVAARVYSSREAVRPSYEFKAQPAIWHQHESVIKDSLPLCDQAFPRIWSMKTPDHFARANGMDGTTFENELFSSVTGIHMTEAELKLVGERIFNLERAIQVRYGRSREVDESVISAFTYPENLGEHLSGDREKLLKLLQEYYLLRGWDPETGVPTKAKLEELGLAEVAAELHRLGKL